MRCTYLDTDVLAERLIGIYGSEDKFQLVVCPLLRIAPTTPAFRQNSNPFVVVN